MPFTYGDALLPVDHIDHALEVSTPLPEARPAAPDDASQRIGDLVAATSEDNYAHLTLVSGERLLVRQTLSSWEDRLPPAHFLRVHRTAILNLNFVQGFQHEDAEVSLVRVQHLREPVRTRRHCWPEFTARLAGLGRKVDF